jgi:4-hydroxybutyryl-CoA dehydratase/vinylacetyl-CoA-Delta-isomerase
MQMSALEYRESLRRYSPTVYVDGRLVESVADDPSLAPGVRALGVSYDFALDERHRELMTATQARTGRVVNRMIHINDSKDDLLTKLEAVRLLCKYTGCAQRYLTNDALNAIHQATYGLDADHNTEYHPRLQAYVDYVQENDLSIGIAMTDAKGDRSLKPHEQPNADVYVHIVERRSDGIVIRGTKAIVTGAPYVHEFLVMPCRTMGPADAQFAVCCAVPIDAPGITIVARPAGRPGEAAAEFSSKYGMSTGVVIFDDVFVPNDRVFLAGEWGHSGHLTTTYATHHRHSCIGARAGFGDLLIGAGVLMIEANGLDMDRHGHIRDAMVELIKIVEGFFACGVAASVYGEIDPAGNAQPDAIFSNVGKLLLATQIYDMHRLANYVSGGLVVALPGPAEDHNPATEATLASVLTARADVPAAQRMQVARMMEDLTASYTAGWYSIISLHGGGSPEAMKREIYRQYPLEEKVQLVEELLDRGVSGPKALKSEGQRGRCCAVGCQVPAPALALA